MSPKNGRRSYVVGFYDHDRVERCRTFPSVRHARALMDDYITAERRGRDSLRRFLLDLDAKDRSRNCHFAAPFCIEGRGFASLKSWCPRFESGSRHLSHPGFHGDSDRSPWNSGWLTRALAISVAVEEHDAWLSGEYGACLRSTTPEAIEVTG
jgi:hypothetical protein